MKKIAVYNGSFDPVTNGHLDIIERAAKIFDILYVTVAIHPTKVGLFTIEQRKELLKKATAHLKNVIVDSTDELFMDYVKKVNGQVLIRGLRSTTDFDYELQYTLVDSTFDDQLNIEEYHQQDLFHKVDLKKHNQTLYLFHTNILKLFYNPFSRENNFPILKEKNFL